MAGKKETAAEKGGKADLLDLARSEELPQSSEINSNELSNSSKSKVVRPMDIDIQNESSYYNTLLGAHRNNGARCKTKKLKQTQLICTKKGLSIAMLDNNSQFGKDPNITLHFTDNNLANDNSVCNTQENANTSLRANNCQPKLLMQSSSLDNRDSDKPVDTNISEWFVCFICNTPKNSAEELQIHINKDHFDSRSEEKRQDDNFTTCFLCKRQLNSVPELQVHINRDHFDSPVKPIGTDISEAIATKVADKDNKLVCIDSEFGHFALTKDEQNDRLIAEMLQKEFDEEIEFRKLQDMYGMTERGNYKKQFHSNLSQAVQRGQISSYEYHMYTSQMSESQLTGIDDGVSCTKGIIVALREYYKQHSKNKDVWLCSDVDHYGGSFGDTGWGCGYRNLQMMLSSLVKEPVYENLLSDDYKSKNGLVASIKRLQQLIERAWQHGFDQQGAEQLGNKLVDTRKWIGATEIVAMLSSLKFKCRLIDIHSPTGQPETHPRMFQWIRDFFKRKDYHEFRSPLYLQYQGHSQTVIGVETSRQTGAITLLILDPASSKSHMKKLKAQTTPALMQPLRKYLSNMTKDQYQIVAVIGTLSDQEWHASKTLKSEKLT
ncbi:zinc finger-containing ubiquitin peptidase 1-like isoform X1 [Octopus sinensis]|uniref:Zinc finger-containing ubiquitin peptidase 1-like isoform X1 n=1 Tax=Octopus sinensis TaxID=2607531 RepID=A0A6P7TJ36_9MOLL|nr:zinc finger-containing ubiquitin peptidase 1-like isoform X1 [Octopus sinensis]XP_036367939.1 zinc finger-containing ubiquitin peptidase 1-like isoform X1 [Octopus sinensis]